MTSCQKASTRTRALPRRALISAVAALVLFASAPCFAQIEPLKVVPINPTTVDDKLAAAQLVLLGRVESVSEMPEEGKSAGRKMRRKFIARVKVEKVYKGSAGADGKIQLLFQRSDNATTPRLLDFFLGEQVILFLKSSETAGYLETLTPYNGKERPDGALIRKLEGESAAKGLTGGIAATIELAASGEGMTVSFRMENTRGTPVLFGSTPSAGADLVLTGPSGKAMQPPSSAREQKAAGTPLLLPAGSYFGYTADISKLFNITTPGKYTLTAVFRPASWRDPTAWTGAVSSNSVSFEVPKK